MSSIEIRPLSLDDYIGQDEIKEQLKMSIEASKKRDRQLPHILFNGSAGLGKTTLSTIMANDFGSEISFANAANIVKPADLLSYILNLENGDFLFIDEIHRLKKEFEEMLYTVMEDFRVDIITKAGTDIKPISIELPKFTLIGATTHKGKLSKPLIDRFGIRIDLKDYTIDELKKICIRTSRIHGYEASDEASLKIAMSSRGTPRKANRIIDRVVDYVVVNKKDSIDLESVDKTLKLIGIDHNGLESEDRDILRIINEEFKGGPVGLNNLAATAGQDKDTLESFIEPYLLKQKMIIRTSKGRKITLKGKLALD
jgi:Holliday junction DNA helicase RuvB